MSFCRILLFCMCLTHSVWGISQGKIQALYSSLDPTSLSQHLAFYELYKEIPEGQKSLNHIYKLLGAQEFIVNPYYFNEQSLISTLDGLISMVNLTQGAQPLPELEENQLQSLELLGRSLYNRRLIGSRAKTEAEVFALPPIEVDLARGLLIAQLGSEQLHRIRTYEVMLDLMALQIQARLPKGPIASEKMIRALNTFVFEELRFRFPPHSLYAKDVDLYTFLPSVLESRRGVCLGVSILYLCLAQRLGLTLEIITPPGHIYLRFSRGDTILNIETTARGIDVETESYLSVNTCALQQRNIKEVIGLAYFNQASVFLGQAKFSEAMAAYEHATKYLPEDSQLQELLGYQYILLGREQEGLALLELSQQSPPKYVVKRESITEDLLQGKISIEAIKFFFEEVDETRASILEKKAHLEKVLEQYPQFRAGWFALATTWLQLHRQREAQQALEYYLKLEPNDPTAHYYLSALSFERIDYNKAWEELRHAEKITQKRNHHPRCLQELRRELTFVCPE